MIYEKNQLDVEVVSSRPPPCTSYTFDGKIAKLEMCLQYKLLNRINTDTRRERPWYQLKPNANCLEHGARGIQLLLTAYSFLINIARLS